MDESRREERRAREGRERKKREGEWRGEERERIVEVKRTDRVEGKREGYTTESRVEIYLMGAGEQGLCHFTP